MRRLLALCVVLACWLSACNLSSVPPTPIPTRDAPTVQFLFPVNESTVIEGTDLEIQIAALDNGAGIARVDLLVDDFKHQEGAPEVSGAVPGFTVLMNWLAQGVGRHSLTAIAYRADGSQSDPVVIVINVLPRSGAVPATTPETQS